MKDVFIFVNGILTNPGNSRAWTDRAVQYFNNRAATGVVSDKFEYYSPALLRHIFQRGHAIDLAETIAEYPGARLHLVGHSNGCDLIARAVRMTSAKITSLHFISAALERDFHKNGLGERIARGQIGHVFCLCSRGDKVLTYLARASRIATLGLLGYGDLGCRGAASPVLPQVWHTWRNSLGHSDWFAGENFERTMETILTQSLYA
jgi:pimeloyl-ACP methyl ester carboxylesterase